MSDSTAAAAGAAPERFTGLMSTVFSRSGEAALIGSFVAGTKTAQSALLNKLRLQPLPNDLLSAALEVGDDEVLWAVSQRSDLPREALEKLIESDSTLVHRTLASSPQMRSDDLLRLLPGDEFVRQRVFMHPAAGRDLRRSIVAARGAGGTPLPRTSSLEQELMKPEYALWLMDSDTQQGRMHALSHLPALPDAYQWHVARKVAEGAVPLPLAVGARGWAAPLQSALRDALAAFPSGGEELALRTLSSSLASLGAPPLYAEDEARLLADESEAEALVPPHDVDWGALERVLRSGAMTVAATRCLLRRPDRTASFTSAALAFHGDSPGVLSLCGLEDLQAACTMSGFAMAERARLVKLVIASPELPYRLLDMVGGLPIRDVMSEIQEVDDDLASYHLQRMSTELSDALGDEPRHWFNFESARLSKRNASFTEAIEAALGAPADEQPV